MKKKMKSEACADSVVKGKNYRITVLTERLLRLEYSQQGKFEDRATQAVLYRDFSVPEFEVKKDKDGIVIQTRYLKVVYDEQPFSSSGLAIYMLRNPYMKQAWHYGDNGDNLKGTSRTLDGADGEILLEDGILSLSGYSVYDDSDSFIINEEGWVEPGIAGHRDIYFWGYGRDYLACLEDFYHLCGRMPMLPRYALGNWWSRYHAYTQEEYLALMDRFEREKIPFSVAVLDMDWHYVYLDEQYGSGWTGYTWNEELFPDHVSMLRNLHERGMHVTLNIHPADGVRAYEKAYPAMAEALGMDASKGDTILFNASDREFMDAYFKCLHHPLEEEGIDFWWIDWQQGNCCQMPGLDPLWILNHYHFHDNERGDKRPLIFSRYAGVGSHRYPVGFSGDTVVSWESLRFQPYFTACASNIGYGWWSHDIGGHMDGIRDDELMVRWVQYGVFSPIMRLHSSCNMFSGKEPWNYCPEEENIMKNFLRLRHMLIPYLYTINYHAFRDGKPLIQPLYYHFPERGEAYEMRNEYFFGDSLLVQPVTQQMDRTIKMAEVRTWLPEGRWYDFFTGLRYEGGGTLNLYREIDIIPVFAKAGAIIVMEPEDRVGTKTDNPQKLLIRVYAGAEGEFSLYEDDGVSKVYGQEYGVITHMHLNWREGAVFSIDPPVGDLSLLPGQREYRIEFVGMKSDAIKKVSMGEKELACKTEYEKEKNILAVCIPAVQLTAPVKIFLEKEKMAENDVISEIYKRLNRAQISYREKERIYRLVKSNRPLALVITELQTYQIPQAIKNMVLEPLLADSPHFEI